MASGFPGGGSELYGGIPARSMLQNTNHPNNNNNNNNNPSHPISSYRTSNTQQQIIPQIFIDQTTSASPLQIPQIQRLTPPTPAPTLMGKRTLAEFQAQASAANHHNPHQLIPQPYNNPNPNMAAINNYLLVRTVRPRMSQFNNNTPHFPSFSPMELPLNNNNHSISAFTQAHPNPNHRHPLLHLQHQQAQVLQLRASQPMMNPNPNPGAVVQAFNAQRDPSFSAEEKLMVDKRLQELEKQLLDDDDEGDENDIVSVITSIDTTPNKEGNNTSSEWSETIHSLNLIAAKANSPNPISPSPTSSSSSSSSSVANTVPPTKQILLEVASAVSEGKHNVALEILSRLCIPSDHKLVDYLCCALKSRANQTTVASDIVSVEHAESTQSLYEVSPCFKLGFMAANLAIVEAAADHDSIHVIDFDIGRGGQYVELIRALSSARPNRKVPSMIKVTAVTVTVGEAKDTLTKSAGEMLTRLAERLGLQFCFNTVALSKPSDLSRASVGVATDEEVVAVNFAFKLYRVPDESVSMDNPRDELLRRVKGLSPAVVTLVEQEMNVNTAPLVSRVNEVYSFYSALMESIEATVGKDSSERANVEKSIMRRVVNSVACEGRDRVERCEMFGKWRARFGMAGFVMKPMGQGVAEAMRTGLNSGSWFNPRFTVKEESGGVCFGWMGKTLTVASSWR